MQRAERSTWGSIRRLGRKAAALTLVALWVGLSGCGTLQQETSPPVAASQTEPALTASARVQSAHESNGEINLAAYQAQKQLAGPEAGLDTPAIPPPSSVRSIRLADVLGLAGVENPVILVAEQTVQSSLAIQLQARALLLPNLNVGGDYDDHTGVLQSSVGAIREVDRQSAYLGLGAAPVGAGNVPIPGIWLLASLGNAYYEPKVASLVVTQRSFEAVATRNNVLLDVAVAYLRLLGAEGRLAVVRQTRTNFAEVVRLTQDYVQAGQGRPADAERSRTDALLLESDERRLQEEVAGAAAALSGLLNLDPTTRLQIADDPVLVVQFIDPARPLPELLEVARQSRPEVQALGAELAAAQARVTQEKVRPFLPTVSVGYSEGGFGGGSNLTEPSFGSLHSRADFGAVAWWTSQNMGFGNVALVRERRAQLRETEGRRSAVLDHINREVTDAYGLSAARLREVQRAKRQLESAATGFQLDMVRIRGFQGLPIELLNSADLLYQARRELLQAILAYDEAQFRLFVALGQPPTLAIAGRPEIP